MHCLFTAGEEFSWRKCGLQNSHEKLRCWLSHVAEFLFLVPSTSTCFLFLPKHLKAVALNVFSVSYCTVTTWQ